MRKQTLAPAVQHLPTEFLHQPELFPASDWTQRWWRGHHSWRHKSEGGFHSSLYDVVPILSDSVARRFIVEHHYGHSSPAARLRYGLYEKGELVGVAVLSVPARNEVLHSVFPGLDPIWQSLELGRFCLLDQIPANAESWMLARVWELAVREGIQGVVSFSDPLPRTTRSGEICFIGHIGISYQASNATYLGRSTPRFIHLLPDGQSLHERMLSKIRRGEPGSQYGEEILVRAGARPRHPADDRTAWLHEAFDMAGVRRVKHPGHHRYAFRCGPRRLRIALGLVSYPYPKKMDSSPLTNSVEQKECS